MRRETPPESELRPLAGQCAHVWMNQKGRYLVEQICKLCKLYRYKSSFTADWEYRAPIPFSAGEMSDPRAY